MTEQTRPNAFAVGMIAGLAGVAAGLLFAPRSGRETRQRIRSVAADAKGRTEEKLEATRDQMSHNLDKARDLKGRLSEAMSATGKKAKEEFGAVKEDMKRKKDQDSPILTAWDEEV